MKIMPDIFYRFWIIIEKNIKRLLSSKISASIILFGPLIMIFLLGAAFQGSGFYGVKIGVYSESYNEISENIIDAMKSSDFTVKREPAFDDCLNNVKNAKTHLCVTFPVDFKTSKMRFYVDYSRLNLVYAIVSKISTEVTELSNQISLGVTEDILGFIAESNQKLEMSGSTLVEIRNNADSMSTQLAIISSQIQSIDIKKGSETIELIVGDQGKINFQLEQSKQQIDELISSFNNINNQLDLRKESMEKNLISVKLSMNSSNCDENNSRDLTQYLKSEDFAQQLASSPNQVCSLLKTMENTLETEISSIEFFIENIDDVLDSSNQLKGSISLFQDSIREEGQSAKQSLAQLETSKENLVNSLSQMSTMTAQSVPVLDSMNEQLEFITGKFKDISLTNATSVIKPIQTSISPLTSRKINTLDIIFPAILVMILMFVGILISNILVMREKTSKAYFRNLILPVKNHVFIIGTYLTTIIITFIQIFIIIVIANFFFGLQLDLNPIRLIPILFLSTIAFASIGMIIGYLTNSEETSTIAAISLTIILLLFSNVIIPIETMEESLGVIAKFTPFNVTEQLLRRMLILGSELGPVDILMIVVFTIQLLLLLVGVHFAYRKENKRRR